MIYLIRSANVKEAISKDMKSIIGNLTKARTSIQAQLEAGVKDTCQVAEIHFSAALLHA